MDSEKEQTRILSLAWMIFQKTEKKVLKSRLKKWRKKPPKTKETPKIEKSPTKNWKNIINIETRKKMNSENNISKEIPQNPQKNPTSPQNKKKLGGGGWKESASRKKAQNT